jgi:hypothetical protein
MSRFFQEPTTMTALKNDTFLRALLRQPTGHTRPG